MELEQEKKEKYEIIDYVTPVKEYIEEATELPENFLQFQKGLMAMILMMI